jgi:hypothetical protein
MQNIQKSLFSLLLCLPALAVLSQTAYNFSETWIPRNYVVPASVTDKTLQVTNSPAVTVSINSSVQVAEVLPTQFGMNTTFRNGPDQRSRVNLYDGIITSMRFPAGSGSNTYFWDGNIPGAMNDYIDQLGVVKPVSGINALAGNAMTPDIFVNFKKDINGEPIVVVNYFYARYGKTTTGTRAARVQQAADYAAGFVRKMNVTLKAGIKYWEVGNECYGKWEAGYSIPGIGTITGKEYGEDFRVFAAAMKAVDPTIKIGAVVYDIDDSWNAGVLPEVQHTADFLSVHEYFTSVNDATLSNILYSVRNIATIKNTLNSCVSKYTSKPAGYFQYAMTEYNSRGPHACSMVNGLFITQVLGELIKHNYGLATIWVSEWNWNAAENSSHGVIAKSDPDQDDFTPRQSYVPFYYYSKCFGDRMLSSMSDNTNVVSYASAFSSGHIGIVLVNTSSTTKTVKLNFSASGKALSISGYDWYEFYANTVDHNTQGYKKFYINAQTSTTPGGGPDLTTVKPYKATPAANSVFNMQPYSVYFIVAYPDNLTSLNPAVKSTSTSERIIPEIIRNETISFTDSKFKSIQLVDGNGKNVLISSRKHLVGDKLAPGIYLLKANYDDRWIINKFIKQ